MYRGYFALWRKIEDHPFYKEPREFSKLEAWIDLLLNCQHNKEPQPVIIGMNVLECHYGETLKSVKTWSNRWMWSRSKVFRYLKLLKKMKQIDFKSETVTTRIIVINFDMYDPRRNGNEMQAECNQNASETQPNTDKNDKNVNNTPPTPPLGGSDGAPSTWKTDFKIYLEQCERSYHELKTDLDWIYQQEKLNPGVDIYLTMEKAKVNYWATEDAWKARKRKKAKSINWKSTWQNAISQRMNRVYSDAVQKSKTSRASPYNFPTCPHCGDNGSNIVKGQNCPYCDKFIPK